MSTRSKKLTSAEITTAFPAGGESGVPPILTVDLLADLVHVSSKTVYFWIAQGRLDGAFRKRGKHHLIWRDRAIEILFNGKEWSANVKD